MAKLQYSDLEIFDAVLEGFMSCLVASEKSSASPLAPKWSPEIEAQLKFKFENEEVKDFYDTLEKCVAAHFSSAMLKILEYVVGTKMLSRSR